MDTQDLDKIKDRIAKLLRMAADASSPNEAAIAAQRARALMDKYQLDAFDVGNRMEEDFAANPATRFYAAIPQYMSVFAVAVAKYNDCQARFEWGTVTYKKKPNDPKQTGKRVVFMGYKSDVELAIQMFDTLNEAVNRLCKEYMNAKGHSGYSVRIGGAFKIGAFGVISQRLEALTKERDAIICNTGTSLMVIKKAAVDEKFGETKYKTYSFSVSNEANESDAYVTGKIKGATVEIVKSVEE